MEERILQFFRENPRDILFADSVAEALRGEGMPGGSCVSDSSERIAAGEISATNDEAERSPDSDLFFDEVAAAIKHLVASGRLMMSKSGRVGLPEAFGYKLGVILINDRGYGFFRPTGGGSDRKMDSYVKKSEMKGALHRDTVLVKIKGSAYRSEAEIVKIVRRASETFIGVYEGTEIIPNDRKIYRSLVVAENPVGAKIGDVVSVKVIGWGGGTRAIRCRIEEILGKPGDRGIDILSVAKQFGLEAQFPYDALSEAESLSREMPVGNRADFRDLPTVTIDGADAKDIDDAISLVCFVPGGGESAHGRTGTETQTRTDAHTHGEMQTRAVTDPQTRVDTQTRTDAHTYGDTDGRAYRLYVHIADVSHYVAPGGNLDREALRRGTSVYLLDRVIPMLPKRLSNDLCSLNAGQDRYALTCVLDCRKDGTILSYEIVKSVIRVDARLEYGGVSAFLEGKDPYAESESVAESESPEGKPCTEKSESCAAASRSAAADSKSGAADSRAAEEKSCTTEERLKCEPFGEMLRAMESLSRAMRNKRMERGAIDFDFPEPEIRLDAEGFPTEIARRERDIASLMIEDFMLAANETVAEHFYWLEQPFLYRVHESPSAEKIEDLKKYLRFFGVQLRGKNENTGIARLIQEIRGEPFEMAVAREALRSMMQARYSEECLGHFGLAAKYYTHFTAPIRRYPDLFVHRIISRYLEDIANSEKRYAAPSRSAFPALSVYSGRPATNITVYECARIAELTSEREQNAESAERKVVAMKMAEYMEDHIGEVFEGTVSGVMSYGIFVQLHNLAEGLIHVTLMPDEAYEYDEVRLTLTGVTGGEVFSVGDAVEVLVAAADAQTGKIDFSLIDDPAIRRKKSSNRRSRGRTAPTGSSKGKSAATRRAENSTHPAETALPSRACTRKKKNPKKRK